VAVGTVQPMAEALTQVPVAVLAPQRFGGVIDPERYRAFLEAIERGREVFAGRIVWNVNSTARGGGVAEMLHSLLAYARGSGVDARWTVIGGSPEFFAVTKRIHNRLHGYAGDGRPLGPAEREVYEAVTGTAAAALAGLVRPQDVVILHDPQTLGMVRAVRDTGAVVVWRCHIGLDRPNGLVRKAWDFLRPYAEGADAYVFSRQAFAWEGLAPDRISVIPPSIDAFSPKNQELTAGQVRSILSVSGLAEARSAGGPAGSRGSGAEPATEAWFVREDGSRAHVVRTADLSMGAPAPPEDVPMVVQVSRWDHLKDPLGVIEGFVRHVAPETDAHLVVAGPSVEAVADDPEGAEVLREAAEAWSRLPAEVAGRVHLAALPMEDGEENAAMVNALQRRADVVVQKSLAEGFGLTVAEAMWKARPVVASRIGGIQDQVIDGVTGLLVPDPRDLEAFGRAVLRLLQDRDAATAMGAEAQRRARTEYLGPRHLMQYLDLLTPLLR
jgi:trehalose synthase